jgi:hypothetical protein
LGLNGPPEVVDACTQAVVSLGGKGVETPPPINLKVDYVELLKTGAWSKRGRAE